MPPVIGVLQKHSAPSQPEDAQSLNIADRMRRALVSGSRAAVAASRLSLGWMISGLLAANLLIMLIALSGGRWVIEDGAPNLRPILRASLASIALTTLPLFTLYSIDSVVYGIFILVSLAMSTARMLGELHGWFRRLCSQARPVSQI